MRRKAVRPGRAKRSQHQARKAVVTALTGRPAANRRGLCSACGEGQRSSTPSHARALGSGSPWAQVRAWRRGTVPASPQRCCSGGARRLHQTSSAQPSAHVGWVVASRIRRSRRFFSEGGRIGAGDPVLGPRPTHAERPERQANRLAPDLAWGQPLREADRCGPCQRPPTGRLAKRARTRVQEGTSALPSLRVEDGLRLVGPGRLGLEGPHAPLLEGMNGMADRWVVATQGARDGGGVLALGHGPAISDRDAP
jgi:hypothetical protein